MFNSPNGARSHAAAAGGTAKRVLSSLLETSGLVCGSLKDTVQDHLADGDMQWVEEGIDGIKIRLEKPREQILDLADKACRTGKGETLSPDAAAAAHHAMSNSFLDDNTTVDGTATVTTAEGGRTTSVTTREEDETTMASTVLTAETPPKNKSRFASVLEEQKKHEQAIKDAEAARAAAGGSNVVIGLCLSRRNPTLGHPDTVTRQTAFDFNELQDRDYKYVSSTDDSGWLAGGGERGDPYLSGVPREFDRGDRSVMSSKSEDHKIAAPDRVHIPIIQINAARAAVIDEIISALARGEIFIPEVAILPENIGVNNRSPPDLQVRFGCEVNDDVPPEEWPNWCLEFLHNQLYEYFAPMGAQWSKRPFQITLARNVRWMTPKHANKYFARCEQVIDGWREKGPQYLQPPHSDDSSRGVILEEITRPHGIYLLQNGKPTNYFAPNMQPPYTTKMRRSLIRNVIHKSWDAKHREWLSEPIPRMRGPVQLMSAVMGCANPTGHLSPVEDRGLENELGIFGVTPDFEPVHDEEDSRALPETPRRAEARRRNNDKEKEARQREKENIISQRRREKERQKHHLESKPTTSMPSDESHGSSTRPGGTMSLTLEETLTETVDDSIMANRSNSTTGESPSRDRQWSKESHEEDNTHFFGGGSQVQSRTSSFGSSKEVSFSDSSLTENEKERKLDREQQWRQQRSLERKRGDGAHERPLLKEPQHKIDERRADKFSRTKTKRRDMRDRRQDESVDRDTPTSKSSPSPSRRTSGSPLSPSNDSMAYSMDSSSQFRPPMAANNNAGDGGSVQTKGTEDQSLLSYVTRSTMVQSRYLEESVESTSNDVAPEGEGDDISLSLLESNSTIVPGDEELKAIGWAKALDTNSGSYYYFTLDRTRTVWENPLATSP